MSKSHLHTGSSFIADKNMIFVDNKNIGDGMDWLRMTKEEADEKGFVIVKCALCKNPAIILDHSYPYYAEYNRCEEHKSTGK